jgi:3-phosphoshikimate 1-carboxyvinyltransferase
MGSWPAVQEVAALPPGRVPDAVVRVPGSKSLTNRALVLAAMARGRSLLRGALWSEDTEACVRGLRAMGLVVECDPGRGEIAVQGVGGGPPAERAEVDVRLSGTTARFLCAYAALGRGVYRFDGTPRMRQRPMGPVVEALRAQGVRVEGGPNLPLVIYGAGGLRGGRLRIAGGETSQPASGLLMVAPFAREDLELWVESPRAALPFVEMTAALMGDFGVPCRRLEPTEAGCAGWRVPAGARYRAGEYPIEPDASAAAYFWALAAVTGGRVRTPGIGRSRLQGDAALLDILTEMGCQVATDPEGGAVVTGPPGGRLRHGSWDLSALADQALTVAVLGLFADGPTTVRNVAHIRLQETDRIAAAAAEVRRLGGRCVEHPDGFTVWPLPGVPPAGEGWPAPPEPVTVQTHGDHRVAMAFSLVGLRRPGVRIAEPAVVRKTFPEFFAVLAEASR